MSPRLTSGLVLLGVFVLGGVTGGAVVRLNSVHRVNALLDAPPMVARGWLFLRSLNREVHLDDHQTEEVRRILAAHEPEMREIRRKMAPETAALRAKTFEEVRRVLRPDQLPRFQHFTEKQERRARRDWDAAEADKNGESAPEK